MKRKVTDPNVSTFGSKHITRSITENKSLHAIVIPLSYTYKGTKTEVTKYVKEMEAEEEEEEKEEEEKGEEEKEEEEKEEEEEEPPPTKRKKKNQTMIENEAKV